MRPTACSAAAPSEVYPAFSVAALLPRLSDSDRHPTAFSDRRRHHPSRWHLLGSRRRHFPRARRVGGDASLIPRVRLSRVYSKSHFWFSGTTFMVVPRQPGPGWHAGKSACRFLWATCDTDKYNGSEVTGVVSPSERRARPVDLMRPFSMSRSSSRFHRRASPSLARHHKLIVAMFSCSLSRISCIILSEFSAGNDESSELLPWSFDSPGYLLSEK